MSREEIQRALASAGEVPARPFPRGVATPDGGTGFLAAPRDAVLAVDLDGGRRIWSAALAGQPLVATDGGVIVARPLAPGALALVLLDARDGRELGRCEVRFAGGVDVARMLADGGLRPAVSEGSVLVEWRATSKYEGGAPPPQFVEERAGRSRAGAFRCELGGERIEAEPSDHAAERTAVRPSFGYRSGGRWRETSWRLDGGEARLARDPDGAIVLETFDAGGAPARGPTVVAESEAVEPTVTTDGRFLLVRRTAPPDPWWRVWSVSGHEQVATVAYPVGADFPAVLEGRLYVLAPGEEGGPPRLVAIDLESGDVLWALETGPLAEEAPPRLPPRR
ncbi:MAG TPA: hypothetical protein VMT85_16530 [Thermoanaerobaculia bacterium]|nr:hypothetical protein [Thermoanaerobaculia bacterium]